MLISHLGSRLIVRCFVSPAEPLSSVSSLEVHFDLLDLTELTDMSDQELAEVFADSDEENHNEFPPGKALCIASSLLCIEMSAMQCLRYNYSQFKL